jgi:hypothetical protein
MTTITFPQEKITEFFATRTGANPYNGQRIGQCFYDFMGFDPTKQSDEVNRFLDRLYEMDGEQAIQFINMHSDYGQLANLD